MRDFLALDPSIADHQRILANFQGKIVQADFEELLVAWLVEDNLPFKLVESPKLRLLFQYLNPIMKDCLPSAITISRRIESAYKAAMGPVTEHLKTARGRIYVTFDGWTSNNHLSLLGLNVHFIDTNWNHCKLLLGVPPVKGKHTGENLADHVAAVLSEFDITSDRLGIFVLDNASNNDTAMEYLAAEFGFDSEECRLRCMGHIINLAVHAFLFGKVKKQAIDDGETLQRADRIAKDAEEWRKFGPVGIAHNITHSILNCAHYCDVLLMLQKKDLEEGVLPAVYKNSKKVCGFYSP